MRAVRETRIWCTNSHLYLSADAPRSGAAWDTRIDDSYLMTIDVVNSKGVDQITPITVCGMKQCGANQNGVICHIYIAIRGCLTSRGNAGQIKMGIGNFG